MKNINMFYIVAILCIISGLIKLLTAPKSPLLAGSMLLAGILYIGLGYYNKKKKQPEDESFL
jgi:uncharacterized membrane protein